MDSDDDDMITVESLQEDTGVTDDQLDQNCSFTHLKKVAPFVENYTKFADHFKLKPGEKSDIKTDQLSSFEQKTEAVFKCWKNKTKNPTYRKFIQACIDLTEGEVARRMSVLCAKSKKAVIVLQLCVHAHIIIACIHHHRVKTAP